MHRILSLALVSTAALVAACGPQQGQEGGLAGQAGAFATGQRVKMSNGEVVPA